jgi:hypothetical protein
MHYGIHRFYENNSGDRSHSYRGTLYDANDDLDFTNYDATERSLS